MFQQDFMSASDYQNPKCNQEYYDPWCEHYKHEGRYTELQIGPAPTQMHVFPVKANSTYGWTEWFKAWMADPKEMHHPDYKRPLKVVSDWIKNETSGMPPKKIDEMNKFFERMARVRPTKEQIVYQGMPWGGLEEKRSGKYLSEGTYFNVTETEETRMWLELLDTGTFSAATLASTPLNFEISPAWMNVLRASMAAGHETWLHFLCLGTEALEVGNVPEARKLFMRSLDMHPHPITARNLATFAETAFEGLAFYQQAWSLWQTMEKEGRDPHVRKLGRDLVSEFSLWLVYNSKTEELADLLDSVPDYAMDADKVLHARIWLAVQRKDHKTATTMIRSHCFPTYGSDRTKLLQLWLEANLLAEAESLGRELTLIDRVKVRRRLGCAGDSDTAGDRTTAEGKGEPDTSCIRGPPNIGYPY